MHSTLSRTDEVVPFRHVGKERSAGWVGRTCKLAVVLSSLLGFTGLTRGSQFNPPVRVAENIGDIDGVALGLDDTGNPGIVLTSRGKAVYLGGFDGFSAEFRVGTELKDSVKQDSPDIAMNGAGAAYVAFRMETGPGVYEIGWTDNRGGSFKPVSVVPGSSGADVGPPAIEIVPDGRMLISWCAGGEDCGEPGRILLSWEGRAPEEVLRGSEASFAVDGSCVVHTAYLRDGDVFYSNDGSDGFRRNEVRVSESDFCERSPKITVERGGRPWITYTVELNGRRELYLTGLRHKPSGLLSESVFPNGVTLDSLPSSGALFCMFPVNDALFEERWLPGGVFNRRKVLDLQGDEELVAAGVDSHSFVHVAVVRSGALYYFNDACPPAADFSADPVSGVCPLEVKFESKTKGHVLKYRWDFGDGSTSLLPDPRHTYKEEGGYTVTLQVTSTAGISATVVKENFVSVEPKKHYFTIPDMCVYAGGEVAVPVRVTNALPFKSFQLVGRYDPEVLSFASEELFLDFSFTVCMGLEPEFIGARSNAEEGCFSVGVVFDINEPFTGKEVGPGKDRNMVNLLMEATEDIGTRRETYIEFENALGNPPVSNILTVQGNRSVYPALNGGKITVLRPDVEWAGPTFIRGDVNNNGSVEVADGIFALDFLFAGGEVPLCGDSADINDDGSIDISDVISMLNFVLRPAAPYPAPPYPFPGLDPTEDSLPACGED